MSHAGIVSKRLKITSNFFLGVVALPLWFSNTAYGCEILTGRGACHSDGIFGLITLRAMAVLYDHAACRYVNTPSAYDTAANQLPILFLPPDDIVSRRFLSISRASCLASTTGR